MLKRVIAILAVVSVHAFAAGADLIILSVSHQDGVSITVSDSNGNTYTAMATYGTGGGGGVQTLYYVQAPVTSAAHTFTVSSTSGFPSLTVLAVSGSVASPSDGSGLGHFLSGVTALQPGSIGGGLMPSQSNELVVTGLEWNTANTGLTVNGGFTFLDDLGVGVDYGTTLGYLIQTTATFVNPTWSWTTSGNPAGCLAAFKSSGTYAIVAHTVAAAPSGGNNVTTPAINTAGSTQIFRHKLLYK